MSVHIPRLPLGKLHPFGRCVLCDASEATAQLHETTLPLTHAGALVCDDSIGCTRRRYQQRHGISSTTSPREMS